MKYKFDLRVRRVEKKRLENREKLGELLASLQKKKSTKWKDSFIEADRNIHFGGAITIDTDKCIACGACAEICPTGAIEIDDKKETRFISHNMQICVGCRKCEKSCDDDAIKAVPGVNLKKFFDGSTELKKEAELVACKGCGRPVGPKAAIDKLRKILEEESHTHSELEFCQKCRKWRTAYEATPRLSILIGRTSSEITGQEEGGKEK